MRKEPLEVSEVKPVLIVFFIMRKGEMLLTFSKLVSVKDSKEVEVRTILEALRIYYLYFQESLIVESDSSNAISWVVGEIKFLSSNIYVILNMLFSRKVMWLIGCQRVLGDVSLMLLYSSWLCSCSMFGWVRYSSLITLAFVFFCSSTAMCM